MMASNCTILVEGEGDNLEGDWRERGGLARQAGIRPRRGHGTLCGNDDERATGGEIKHMNGRKAIGGMQYRAQKERGEAPIGKCVKDEDEG